MALTSLYRARDQGRVVDDLAEWRDDITACRPDPMACRTVFPTLPSLARRQ